jgi:hypothetical protein
MTRPILEESPLSKARAAGGLWWLCIVAGTVGFVAGAPLIVANDATATAANILAKESLFRLGFAADLISGLSYVGVTIFIYYVLKPVSRSLSLLGAFFGLAGVAIGGASWVIHLAPLLLLHGALLAIGGTCYLVASFANFLTPSFGPHLVPFMMPVALIGEGSLGLWLLVKGVNVQRWNEQASLGQ